MRFNRNTNKWEQLFADSALDRYKNLSEIADPDEARVNLKIPDHYWDKDELKNGTAVRAININCINETPKGRLVTDEEKKYWNQKVDRPIITSTLPDINDVSEAQIVYDPVEDRAQIRLNGKYQSLKLGNIRGAINGYASFAGQGKEVAVKHGAKKADGAPVTPMNAVFNPTGNPRGQLGETWVRFDNTYAYFGNTGRYKGQFAYTIFY